MKKIKAFTIQSILVGSVIMSIITVTAISLLYPSIDKAKENLIKSKLMEQYSFISNEKNSGFKNILLVDQNNDNDNDILDELINAKFVSNIKDISFIDFTNTTWIIEKEIIGDNIKLAIKINSTNNETQKIIENTLSEVSFVLNEVSN
jgi:type II secretory pathway pseudopilin PulG